MERAVMGLFCAGLVACVAVGASVLWALAFGLALFLAYGRHRGFSWKELAAMALDGVRTVKNILLMFVLIGMMTALWRACGTIPVFVCYTSGLIRPSVFLLATFLLNCAVSALTGTSFGTSATMGVICAGMGAAMGVDPALTGGAVLSGAFFGDRCSPVSTSALLVAGLTKTDIFDNIGRMARTAIVPFALACAAYALLGFATSPAGDIPDLEGLFSRAFAIHWAALVPAVVILLLSALRVDVKVAMGASILAAAIVCVALQHVAPLDLVGIAVSGYRCPDAEVGAMVDGGGVASMLAVSGIVCLSSSYSGIFQKTGLLGGARRAVEGLARRTTGFAAVLAAAVATGVVACNQTLSIMLTDQLCEEVDRDPSELALDLADTAVVVSPLVPWSIAGAVPLAAVGAPTAALLFACYLYLLPLWRLARSFARRG